MSLTDERQKDGSLSLRMKTTSKNSDEVTPINQRSFGAAGAIRRFKGEDWSRFNRISLWVYPDLPWWRVITARVFLYDNGKVKIPGGASPVYQAAQGMKNREWNQVVWEITDLSRECVTGIKFEVRRQGNEPGASDTLIFDIDHLELQQV